LLIVDSCLLQKKLTIDYKDATLDGGYRLDFVMADQLMAGHHCRLIARS
jgi:hypothetical protein